VGGVKKEKDIEEKKENVVGGSRVDREGGACKGKGGRREIKIVCEVKFL